MQKKVEQIIRRNRDAIVRAWADELKNAGGSYRRRPIHELRGNVGMGFDANTAFMCRGDKEALDRFIDMIVERRYRAKFRLSEVQNAFQIFRTLVRSLLIRSFPSGELDEPLDVLDRCVSYGVRCFSEKFQARHESEIVYVNQVLSQTLEDLKIERHNAMRSQRLKDQFLSNISHELKTPLTSIIGFSKLLMSDESQEFSGKDKLRIIHEQGNFLLRMINTLLMISEIEAGTAVLRKDAIEMRDVVEFAIRSVKKSALAKNHDIRFSCNEDIPPMLGDSEKLTEVFIELILNAIKFSGEGATVGVCCRLEGDTVVVTVQDDGIGMDDKQLKTIFTPFQQVDGSITRRYGGNGLGLTMIDRVINLHQGKIHVESTPRKGSLFRVELPFEPAKRAPTG